MNKCLLGKNLQGQYVNGDGNCFFHALVESLPDNMKLYVLKNYGSNYWAQFRISTIEWLNIYGTSHILQNLPYTYFEMWSQDDLYNSMPYEEHIVAMRDTNLNVNSESWVHNTFVMAFNEAVQDVNVNVHILSPTSNDVICVMQGSNTDAFVQANVLFDGHAHYYAIVSLDPNTILVSNDSNNVVKGSCKNKKNIIKKESKRAHLLASEEGLVILSEIREKDKLRKQKSRKKLKLLEVISLKDISTKSANDNLKFNENIEISPNKKQKTRETVGKHRFKMNSTDDGKENLQNLQKTHNITYKDNMNSTEEGKENLINIQKKHNMTYKDSMNSTDEGKEKWKNSRKKYYVTYRDRKSEMTKNYTSDLENFSTTTDNKVENANLSDGIRKKIKLLEENCLNDISTKSSNNNLQSIENVEELTSEHKRAKLLKDREKNRLKQQKHRNKLKLLKDNIKSNDIISSADNKLELFLETENLSNTSDNEEENVNSSDGFNSDYGDSVSSLIENRIIDNLPDPSTFCVTNDMKAKDSKKFREAMDNGLPNNFPCSACNEEASKNEMEKNVILLTI